MCSFFNSVNMLEMETKGRNKEVHFKTKDWTPWISVEIFIVFLNDLEKGV